jgi:hypothetical protein
MKQKNRYASAIARKESLQKSRDQYKGKGEPYKKNVAGCSLKRVDTSMHYEDNIYQLIQQLRYKHLVVNDGPTTLTVEVSKNYSVQVAPKSVYVGSGKEIGNKTRGKLDFLKGQGFTIFGWRDLK